VPNSSEQPQRKTRRPRRVGFAYAVTLAASGPSLWFTDLVSRYFLVEAGVARAHEPLVAAIGVLCASFAAGTSAWAAWALRARAPEARDVRFVLQLGVVLGAFSALVIGAALVPHLFFGGVEPP
jgi:hypothetical protein